MNTAAEILKERPVLLIGNHSQIATALHDLIVEALREGESSGFTNGLKRAKEIVESTRDSVQVSEIFCSDLDVVVEAIQAAIDARKE